VHQECAKIASTPHQESTMSPMLFMSAAAQPPPLQIHWKEVRKPHMKRFGLCIDVAHERRGTAATASDEFEGSLQAALDTICSLQLCFS